MTLKGCGVFSKIPTHPAYEANQTNPQNAQKYYRSYRTGRSLPIKENLSPEVKQSIRDEAWQTYKPDNVPDYDKIDSLEGNMMGRCACVFRNLHWSNCRKVPMRTPANSADPGRKTYWFHNLWTIFNCDIELCPLQVELYETTGKWGHCDIVPEAYAFEYGPGIGFDTTEIPGDCPVCKEEEPQGDATEVELENLPERLVATYFPFDDSLIYNRYKDPRINALIKYPLKCTKVGETNDYIKEGLYYHENDLAILCVRGLKLEGFEFLTDKGEKWSPII